MSGRGYIVAIGGAEDRTRSSVILGRFVELCGGRRARIAVLPTASQLDDTGRQYERVFRNLGAYEARSFPFEERAHGEREDWLHDLERADGVFLTGGNQLRLMTTLGGTRVTELLRERNAEGMHVAGTSAGAAVLSEHMIAYGKSGPTPRGGAVTLAPGLGLLKPVIIDQHFRQRDRLGRLLTALAYNPRLLGLGIDEDTAAFVAPDDVVEVCGSGTVTVADASEATFSSIDAAEEEAPVSLFGIRLHVLGPGSTYDIGRRQPRPPKR